VTNPIAAAMAEDELQANIMDACKVLGLLAYHTHDARRSPAGFPDLCIVGRRLIFRELKTQRGKLTPDQSVWLHGLRRAGVDADVWRPEQWCDGSVMRQLQAMRIRGAR